MQNSFGTMEVERIQVLERDPATIQLLPGWCIFKREIKPEKVGSLYRPPGAQMPGKKGTIVALGPKRDQDEEILVGAVAHVHGYARAEVRLLWEKEHYDLLQRDDILAVEVA